MMGKFFNNGFSKGGLVGALVGLLASFPLYKHGESNGRKVVKTTLLTGAGYGLGMLIENWLKKKD